MATLSRKLDTSIMQTKTVNEINNVVVKLVLELQRLSKNNDRVTDNTRLSIKQGNEIIRLVNKSKEQLILMKKASKYEI